MSIMNDYPEQVLAFSSPRTLTSWFDYPVPVFTARSVFGLTFHISPQEATAILISSCCEQPLERAYKESFVCEGCARSTIYDVYTKLRLPLKDEPEVFMGWVTPHKNVLESFLWASLINSTVHTFLARETTES